MTSNRRTSTGDRSEQFKADIAGMRLKTGRANAERLLELCGAGLMVGGVVIALGAYFASLNVSATPGTNVDVLDSSSYTALSIAGLAISITGGLLFLRYSLARFLRFWLLRQIYEQRAAIEQVATDRSGEVNAPGASAPRTD